MKLNNKTNKGFTIIEVLIVLAIVGVIMSIVLFAVPNLQRNSRNTQIRTDANNLLAYANEWSANNNGATPVSGCYDSQTGFVNYSGSSTCTVGATSNVGKIRTNLTVTFPASGASQPAAGTTQTLVLALNSKCSSKTLPSPAVATSRALAVGFNVETSSGTDTACVEN